MPITKAVQADNGVTLNYHRAARLDANLLLNLARVEVHSYPSEQAALDALPIGWNWNIELPADQISGTGTLLDELEALLIASSLSPFQGGEIVADKSDTLDAAKDRAWTAVKAARAVAEAGDFTYDGGVYQINVEQVTGCVTAAMLAKQASQAYAQDWTLTNNTVRTLDADQMIAMGLAMLKTISAIYATGRTLRAQIDDATKIEDLQDVRWPA